jgi:uncharacterized protein (DUF2062 family)
MPGLARFLPSPETLQRNRWLRWLGPALHHPRLWHISRRGLALGMAVGVFFGLLIPIAQIPLSAAAAVALRANVPAAVASTLVTNPVTFGPVYYVAWRLGNAVIGTPVAPDEGPPAPQAVAAPPDAHWWDATVRSVLGVGRPLLVGLAILACSIGVLTYFAVSWIWALKVRWSRRRRRAGGGPERP